VLSLTGAATALGLLCRATGLSPRAGLGAAGLFLLSYASTFDLYDYRRIDPLAYCAMAFVLLCLARRQFMLAGACILVATLDKECGLFLLPIFVLALLRERARDARYRLTAFCLGVLLPIMAYWIVRHWPGFGNGALERFYGEQSTWSIVGFIRANMVAAHSTLVAALVNALGALWLVAVLGWNRARPIMFLSLLLIPPVFAQLLFATDWERMLAYATLPVIPFVVAALEALPPRRWYACIALLGASESVGLTLLLGASASLPPWALVAGDLPLVAVLSVAIIVLAAPWTRRHAVCT
jgi:uncharacterized membrane protein